MVGREALTGLSHVGGGPNSASIAPSHNDRVFTLFIASCMFSKVGDQRMVACRRTIRPIINYTSQVYLRIITCWVTFLAVNHFRIGYFEITVYRVAIVVMYHTRS